MSRKKFDDKLLDAPTSNGVIRFAFRLTVLFFLIMAFFYLPENFMTLGAFRVKKIIINNGVKNSLIDLTDIEQITYNKSVWDLDFDFLEEKIKEDIRIKDVKIQANSIGMLSIEAIERSAFCYAQIDGNLYLIDDEGNVFGFFNESPMQDMPIICIDNENDKPIMLGVLHALDNNVIRPQISQIFMRDPYCIELLLANGVKIYTNSDVEQSKYTVLQTLYSNLIKNSNLEYIDIRFDDFVVKEKSKI